MRRLLLIVVLIVGLGMTAQTAFAYFTGVLAASATATATTLLAGATLATVNTAVINNWTVGASITIMFFDTVLYALLAYYADQVLPTWLRDYGTPRAPWFCCLPSFWGEICAGWVSVFQ